MDIGWDVQKNAWLKDTSNVSFEQIAGIIFAEQYLDIVDNPTRKFHKLYGGRQ